MKNKYEEDYTIKKWIAILVVVLVLVFLFFILLMGYAKLKESTTLDNINGNVTLVISFIGVIATFIVVGNFSQVSAMRDDVRETKNSMKQENADFKDKILAQIEELQTIPEEIKSLKLKNELIDKIQAVSKENSSDIAVIKGKKDYTSQLIMLLIKIATDKELVDLLRIFFPLQNTYSIHIVGENPEIEHNARVTFSNGSMVFTDSETQREFNNIDRVSSFPYKDHGKYIALIEEILSNTIDNNPNFYKDIMEDISTDIEGVDNEQDAPNNNSDIQ